MLDRELLLATINLATRHNDLPPSPDALAYLWRPHRVDWDYT
jgi:hypothetical protein